VAIALWPSILKPQEPAALPEEQSSGSYSIKTSVRRVVVDIVVTDSQGTPKRGLTQHDFSIEEDGKPQRILTFDSHENDAWTGLLPANVPPNTFINLPRQPEQGPLYVLLYDMVNTGDPNPTNADTSAQIFARQQLVNFIDSKPQGSRFALLAIPDGLHLIQGFTSDKQLLLTALDPAGKTPHLPKVLLYSGNYRFGDPYYYLAVMKDIGQYLDGIPGRKNLIWVSSRFPFALFAVDGEPQLIEDVRKELTELAANQIAIYPVDAGGVHSFGKQDLALDEVANETGGHAFHGNNDLAGTLDKAVDDGKIYYTLSYSSTNKDYNGKLRHIEVKLAEPGFHLAYRQQYYADAEAPVAQPLDTAAAKAAKQGAPGPPPDTLFAYIRHGAPMSHDLLFSANARTAGAPTLPTAEQMADLASEPAFFRKRRKSKPQAPLPPVPLQSYEIEFDIPARQFRLQPATGDAGQDNFEFAVAAYDADGALLNGSIGHGSSTSREQLKYYRAVQQLNVPTNAAWISLAVRDIATGRIGNVEFALPLAGGSEPSARKP
jgi:VWFA-related protein